MDGRLAGSDRRMVGGRLDDAVNRHYPARGKLVILTAMGACPV